MCLSATVGNRKQYNFTSNCTRQNSHNLVYIQTNEMQYVYVALYRPHKLVVKVVWMKFTGQPKRQVNSGYVLRERDEPGQQTWGNGRRLQRGERCRLASNTSDVRRRRVFFESNYATIVNISFEYTFKKIGVQA